MKRCFLSVIIFIVVIISACGNNPAASSGVTSLPETASEQSKPVASAPDKVELPPTESSSSSTDAGIKPKEPSGTEILYTDSRDILYRFIPESGLYDISKLLELEDNADCNDIFNAVTDEVFPNKEIPTVNSMSVNKGYLVCDLGEEWLDSFDKGQLHDFCNTLVMTMIRNGYCESAGFRIDGKTGLLGGEFWELAELKVLETSTAEEFAKIREAIRYTGLRINGGESYFDVAKSLKKDDAALKLHQVLRRAGELTNEFDHPSEMDMENAIQNLIWCTEPVDIDPNSENYNVLTAQTIMPIAASVSQRISSQENWFWIKEHIDESAWRIFGNDVVIKHCDPILPYKWFETEGVYTPPHMGGGWNIIPHLYNYSVDGETITAEVAYLRETMQGYYDPQQDKFMDNYDDVDEYLENRAQRHTVIMQTEADGRLTIRQHHLSNFGGN